MNVLEVMQECSDALCTAEHAGLAVKNNQARAAVAELIQATSWQPIETAPKDGRTVIGDLDGYVTPIYWKFGISHDFWACLSSHGKVVSQITGWQPLPESQKASP